MFAGTSYSHNLFQEMYLSQGIVKIRHFSEMPGQLRKFWNCPGNCKNSRHIYYLIILLLIKVECHILFGRKATISQYHKTPGLDVILKKNLVIKLDCTLAQLNNDDV